MKLTKYLSITLIKYYTLLFFILFNVNTKAIAEEVSDKVAACTLALNKGDFAKAVTVSEALLKLAPNNRDGLLCKGRALGALGKYNEALSALELAEMNTQPGFDEIISYIFIGNLHKDNNKNAEAIAAYEQSLKVCELEKNEKFKRINLNLIAEAQIQNNDLNAALSNYLAGAKLANNDNERADSYERLAATYSVLGQYDSAIEYQLKGVLMQQKAGTLDQYANASSTLGQIYVKAKDYANAEKTYAKLIQFAKDNGGAYYEAKADYDLAQIKALSGDTDGAKAMMTDALSMAKNIGERDLAAEIEASMKRLNDGH
jgi:tetratricopeptide (TPR) repeat protein